MVGKREKWASHLRYEITTMTSSRHWTGRWQATAPGALTHDELAELEHACLESFLVHVRLLIEFLVGRRKLDDEGKAYRTRSTADVRPRDFDGAAWVVDSADADVTLLDAALPDIDKHLAHLSQQRGKDIDPPEWSLADLELSVLALMDRYISGRSAGNVRQALEIAVSDARGRVADHASPISGLFSRTN